jgi:hypothetical protein
VWYEESRYLTRNIAGLAVINGRELAILIHTFCETASKIQKKVVRSIESDTTANDGEYKNPNKNQVGEITNI